MSTNQKPNGTKYGIGNKPGKNGNPSTTDWENAGNIFIDANGRFGTLYLNLTVAQLESFLALAKDSPERKLDKKFTIARRDAKPEAKAA